MPPGNGVRRSTMTSYCSLLYLMIFLPAVIVAYALAPARLRWLVLLGASYAFFWELSGKLLLFLLLSTGAVWLAGLRLAALQEERNRTVKELPKPERKAQKALFQKRQRRVLAVTVLFELGLLAVLKYAGFTVTNLNHLLAAAGGPILPIPAFVLPIGISFYTLQAVSYLTDVYRESIKADRNLGRLALFMGFFPQIMEGPICRYLQTAPALWAGRPITWRGLTFGCQRIAFGLLKKMVVADRLNILIETVFDNYAQYDGGIIALAMFSYTFQLYMEFSGTMDVVIGSAEIFGVALPENFRQPFLSRSIAKFWTRWHITLGTWFKDYVFYPLSVSKKLGALTRAARKRLGNQFGPMAAAAVALFAVWLGNGVWHGAGWNYIFFGLYHFCLIMLENVTEPFVEAAAKRQKFDRNSRPWRIVQILRTFLLVNIGELFFRAESLRAGMAMFGRMAGSFSLAGFRDGTVWTLGIDGHDFVITAIALLIVFFLHGLRERGISVRERLAAWPLALRWAAYAGLCLFILIFGAYGKGYIPVDPIYANF